MIHRASSGPVALKQNILVALSMSAAVALIGCGGGGGGGSTGGGTGPGDCGSVSSSGVLVACGFVVPQGSTSGVNGLTVNLKSAVGATLISGITVNDPVTGRAGFFKINVPVGAATFNVSFAGVSGYLNSYLSFRGQSYDVGRTASAGGPCIPALVLPKVGQDNMIGTVVVFPDSGPPPSPVFTCPR